MSAFSGGEALERKLRELAERLGNGVAVKVGFLSGATYPDGTPAAMVAAVNEFGDPGRNQPPRPYFRNMIQLNKSSWGKMVYAALKQSDFDPEQTMEICGEIIRGQLQQSIRNFDSPALAASTIRRKGSSKPLVETGHMLNSVDFEVDTNGSEPDS